MKIDPYNYPLIIILAFAVGMILAMVFGFRPRHSGVGSDGHGQITPALVETVPSWEVHKV